MKAFRLQFDAELADRVISSKVAGIRALASEGNLDPSRDFRGLDLRGLDLTGQDLRGFDFSASDLRNTNIQRALTDETTILNGAKLDLDTAAGEDYLRNGKIP